MRLWLDLRGALVVLVQSGRPAAAEVDARRMVQQIVHLHGVLDVPVLALAMLFLLLLLLLLG